MGFFTLSTGDKATGNEDKAHYQGFRIIPNNSKLLAVLVDIKKNTGKKAPYYEVIWEIYQGEYRGQKVTQRIFPWASDERASDRAKEMMFRIYRCCGTLPPELEPAPHELSQLCSKICGIKIKEEQYEYNGEMKDKNDIIEVHPAKEFKEETGQKLQYVPPKQKPKNDELNPPHDDFVDSDLPF